MSIRVFLVDEDPDALADVAAALRRRGHYVQIATDISTAEERARTIAFDVIVAPRRLLNATDVERASGKRAPAWLTTNDALPMHEVEQIVQNIESSARDSGKYRDSARSSAEPSESSRDSRDVVRDQGGLSEESIDRVLARLTRDRASGVLALQAGGLGEVRLVNGDVVEARYGRHSSVKAMARLLALREGRYVFRRDAAGAESTESARASGERSRPSGTGDLLRVARQRATEAAHLRQIVMARGGGVFVANEGMSGDLSESARAVLTRLRTPTMLDELLEEVPLPDDAILGALVDLEGAGRIRRLAGVSERVLAFTNDERDDLRRRIGRLAPAGFELPLRVIFAATPGRLGHLAHAFAKFAEGIPVPAPSVLVAPYALVRLAFADDAMLEIVALPLVPAYAPLWPLYIAGAHSVVVLDDAARQPLDAVCDERNVPRIDAARALGTSVDDVGVEQVAALVRRSLER